MQLKLLDKLNYTIMKFPTHTKIPMSFHEINDFKSITYAEDECSIVVPCGSLETDQALSVDNDWFIIQIVGELDFSLIGILTQLANPLAENHISIFALSTYNTDYLLIKNKDKDNAIRVLCDCGHTFH
ncbi:ACT domain-containing protein [Enterococcus sp. AZ177]|uniref:ACT domain-containing protein n=1 Tax=unclassified Enterococcus TaxID=2608891 RepID=UPI003D2FB074